MTDKVLPLGKLPIALLESLLQGVSTHDPDLLVGPKVGEDAAVVRVGDQHLIIKTDPITFLSEDLAWYLVTVNANDIACMGVTVNLKQQQLHAVHARKRRSLVNPF